ncbi:hypothetical protein ACFL1R_08095 [Candidatus Latescibacterota bacterium]
MKKLLIMYITFILLLLQTDAAADEISKADSLLNAKKHFSFAVQYKKNKDYASAYEQYVRSIAYNDTVYQVHFSFADLLIKMNRPVKARCELLRSLTLNPSHYQSAAGLASLYYESAQYDSALVLYEKMYCFKPGKELLASIAGLRNYLGKKEEALEAYTELIKSGEDSYEILMNASSLAVAVGKLDKGQQFITLALQKKPGDNDALKAAAKISLARDDTKSSILYLRQLVESGSNDLWIITKLEDIYRYTGNTKNLIRVLERHHKLIPGDSKVIGDLSELLFSVSETNRGAEYVKKGLELSPNDGKLRILLGDYYVSQNETEKALKEYRIALKDEKWRSSAQQLIWRIEKPLTEEEKVEKDFFERGKQNPD